MFFTPAAYAPRNNALVSMTGQIHPSFSTKILVQDESIHILKNID
jgi:hypothetical protein